ncbi:MAG: DUF3293 domain-containing protein [Gemmatimonadota bacterium]|nr:DUF3293 domain-containing protein [Gemmatimonadota bacterium]
MGDVVGADLRTFGLGDAFGVVTACNPLGVPQPAGVNRTRTTELQSEVLRLGCAWVPVDACSTDGSHFEPSVAIAASIDESLALARRYHQLAIFWFDGVAFWIVSACSRNARVRLPVHA